MWGLLGVFKGVAFLPHVSKVFSLEDIELVLKLATRACGGTVLNPSVYHGVLGRILGGFVFLCCVSKVYRLEDIELVPNLATRALGGTVLYPVSTSVKCKGVLLFTPCL